MKIHSVCCLLFTLTGFISAHAAADGFSDGVYEPRGGMYVSGTFGYAFEYEIESNDFGVNRDIAEFDMDSGEAYTGALGFNFGQARLEFEAGYRAPDALKSNPPSLGETVTGDLEYFTLMGNAFYDFPLSIDGMSLYVGGGAGIAIITGNIDFDPPTTVTSGFTSATTDVFDDTNTTFAYQFMTGLSYEVVDNVTLTGGYRIRLFSEFSDDNSLLVFREHEVHALEVGLRIDF